MKRLALLTLLAAGAVHAQPDSLHLGAVQDAAVAADPRARQSGLLEEVVRLRLANLTAQRLPQLTLSGQGTVQSSVFELPVELPGLDLAAPPSARFQLQVEADQLLYDGGRLARRAELEQAVLSEQRAGVTASLYALREATAEVYFTVLLAEAQAAQRRLQEHDLAARLAVVQARVRNGAALAADAAALEAEAIRVTQLREEAEATARAARAVLERLAGRPLADQPLAVPRLDAAVAEALAADTLGRPESVRFRRVQDRSRAEARLAALQNRPLVTLFGQGGLGRPSPFDPLGATVEPYGLVGVRLRWAVWDGGQAARTAEAARRQADVAATEAEAFTDGVARTIEHDRAQIARLDRARAQDARVLLLREEVLRVAARQLDEGVLLPADYADRLSDLTEARLAAARHRIERAHAQARLLLTLGFPLP